MSTLRTSSAASTRLRTTSRSRSKSWTPIGRGRTSPNPSRTYRRESWPWQPRSSTSRRRGDCSGLVVTAISARRAGSRRGCSIDEDGRRSRSVGFSVSITRRCCMVFVGWQGAESCSCADETPRRESSLRADQRGDRLVGAGLSRARCPVPPAASIGSLVALLGAPGQAAMRISGTCLFGSPRARVPPKNAALGPRGAGGAPGSAPRRQPQEEPSHEGPRDSPHPPRRHPR
jgi:hypothetical protein